MERDQLRQIDIGYAVAIGEAEAVVANVLSHAPQATACQRLLSRLNERDAPGLGVTLMHVHAVLAHVERDIGHVEEVVGKILLDDIALVSQANDEIVDPVMRVNLHDVPEDRPAPDLDHGFWLEMGFLADASAQTSGKDDNFHR